MMRPIYYATDSVLHLLHPLSKVVALIPVFLFLALVTDLWTPLIFMLLHLAILLAFARIPPMRLAHVLAPLLIMLIGLLVCYPPFVGSNIVAGSPLLFAVGPLQVRLAGVLFSLATCLRLLAFSIVMLVFMLTTDATELVRALVQQWHVNYRLGYAVMIAYRFLPMLEQELRLIRIAQKVRGVTTRRGLLAEAERTRRAFLPLLAGAIRNAERKALAMDARAFGAFPARTYYRRMSWKREDWLFMFLYWLASALVIAILLWRGLLVI
jgi:energy-coupling factor transport system permease protein